MSHLLTCNCGSTALRLVDYADDDFEAWEKYQCQLCGHSGTLTMYQDDTTNWLTGCLSERRASP